MKLLHHALAGLVLGWAFGYDLWLSMLFSIGPDIPQALILYPLLAYKHKRIILPLDGDWKNFSKSAWSHLYFAPHSLLFVAILSFSDFSAFFIGLYSLHILVDIPTHTGEWSIRLLWPASWKLEGFFDAWKRS
ncbi:TPA: hypothetical protein H1008_00065 [archaeon]|nr:hypothetical protein [Candidatus Undinarchaeales archaeon SRR5007147.bin71]